MKEKRDFIYLFEWESFEMLWLQQFSWILQVLAVDFLIQMQSFLKCAQSKWNKKYANIYLCHYSACKIRMQTSRK